jgi:hypothetical protein
MYCKNCDKNITDEDKIRGKKETKTDDNKIIKISLKKMILIALLLLILICIIVVSVIISFNYKKENITIENNLTDSQNNTTFSKMSDEDKIDFAVYFMQEYDFLLNFYFKALGYTEKPYESIKINSISLAENGNDKYVLSDFTVVTKEKESIFRYGIQAQPSITEDDIKLFFENNESFKKQKQDKYTTIQNNNYYITELDSAKVQEKFENENMVSTLVEKKVYQYQQIANSINFDQLATDEYIFISLSTYSSGKTPYYANFKKSDGDIVQFPISSKNVNNGLIPNGIYHLKKKEIYMIVNILDILHSHISQII